VYRAARDQALSSRRDRPVYFEAVPDLDAEVPLHLLDARLISDVGGFVFRSSAAYAKYSPAGIVSDDLWRRPFDTVSISDLFAIGGRLPQPVKYLSGLYY
jgi:hypothetical protein